jgi:hypothetical protein
MFVLCLGKEDSPPPGYAAGLELLAQRSSGTGLGKRGCGCPCFDDCR